MKINELFENEIGLQIITEEQFAEGNLVDANFLMSKDEIRLWNNYLSKRGITINDLSQEDLQYEIDEIHYHSDGSPYSFNEILNM
jgi:hypothetical protein